MVTRALAAVGKRIPDWFYTNPLTRPIVRRVGPYVASAAASLADGVFYDERDHALVYDSNQSEAGTAGYVKGYMWFLLTIPLLYVVLVLWQVQAPPSNPLVGVPLAAAVIYVMGLGQWVEDIELQPLNHRAGMAQEVE